MVMIPPLVRDPPPDDRQSSTARPVASRMARTQRRYASNYNISYVYEPPRPITKPGFPTPQSTFDKWRAAAAELDLPGGGAGDPPDPAARGEASPSGVAATPRRTLHDALLGTTAVVLLGVLGGIGYIVWSGAVPGALAPGGTAPKGSVLALRPAPQPAALLPPPSTAPNPAVLAAPSADKPALTGPPPPAPSPSAVAGEAAPAPAPEQATAAVVLPAKVPEPDATSPAPAVPAGLVPAAEPAAAKTVPPASDAAPAVPAIASVTVRLPPSPEWTTAPPAALAGLPEAAALPSAPPALPAAAAGPMLPAEPAAVPAEMAKVAPPGVGAQQVVSTMALVQQMSLLVHDMHGESLRYRTEVTALTGAVQAKASSLEERLKLAEARSAAAAGSDAGGLRAGLGGSDLAGDGGGLRATTMPQVLRGYRVQAGSPGAAVLTDVGAGPERAARLLVMVGDQLPGAGRVTAIVERGRAWIVRTERGVIQ